MWQQAALAKPTSGILGQLFRVGGAAKRLKWNLWMEEESEKAGWRCAHCRRRKAKSSAKKRRLWRY
jgi:hypothetical protein